MPLKRLRDYSLPKEQGRYIKDPETLKLAREMEHKYIGDASAQSPEAIQGLQDRIKGLSALSLLMAGKGNKDTQSVADEYMGQIKQDVGQGASGFLGNAAKSIYGETPEIRRNAMMEGYGQLPFNTESLAGKIGLAGITAFHGSPHKFDKFKMDKIGTGEGAQAYGHGLYFAESPGVAKSYQEALSDSSNVKFKDGTITRLSDWGDFNTKQAANYLARADNNYDKARKLLNVDGGTYSDEISEWLDVMQKQGATVDTGNLYKVDISDDAVKNFLDWDKPLSQQPESVRKAMDGLLKKWKSRIDSGQVMPDLYDEAVAGKLTGKDLLTAAGANQEEAAKYLKSIGIKGIKYLDQGSREGGKGTSNYVVFDEDIVKVLSRE